MVHAPTPEEEALAQSIVADGLEGFEHILPARELEALRAIFETELVATEKGQRMLRACRPDPVVTKSDEVATDERAQAKPRKVSGKE